MLLAATARKIVDPEGLPLGTDAEGKRGAYPKADGHVIENAFLKPFLSLADASADDSAEKRWNRLHAPSLRFSTAQDMTPPRWRR